MHSLVKNSLHILVLAALAFSPLAFGESAEAQDEFSRWNEAVSEAFTIKAELNEFITILGGQPLPDDSSDDDWNSESAGVNEDDNTLLQLLLEISKKQNKALRLSQKAVEKFNQNYFEAKMFKNKACFVSGGAKLKTEGGLFLAKTDFSLSQQQVFIMRFESISRRLERFRALLGCFLNL